MAYENKMMWLCKLQVIFKFAGGVHGCLVTCPCQVIIVSTEASFILPQRKGVKNRNRRHGGTVREGFDRKKISQPLNHMHIVKTLALEGII